ncbi:uncharacterized protein AMSG_10226 [Thecamonas trahens ATCC 50062]|uniref:Peptidase C39-like domain-containing protein n=1 Tax=Thecamonas trahens ATCC 50062 TaxID=461836 RepID=A0A0L0DRQ9_THETB|nr:hypothetical protein AMSG_10226 [Thecamonas trahens ATCC 50062]KNC54980.1 hypothetical protein AMSG_10226 [Thecamonas trahens ATCC 50062]|eukprot:XP_013753426.1 hypothetical protein AMSG_10226 [Thecamonas trahens ATCC 50062]
MKGAILLTVLAVVVTLSVARHVIPHDHWPMFKQCDPRWGNERLGDAGSPNTICQAGCAMTSTTMALAHFNTTVDKHGVNPGTVNSWLVKHGGFADKDLIIWSAVSGLGTMKVDTILQSPSASVVHGYINKGHPVIMHVRDNTHFVLGIGYDSENPNMIVVNDPAFTTTEYNLSGVTEVVVYARA